ncbi:DNA polymerase/3'-5' exonuclease PolX [Natronogracilivirga saccharolytica]|uniref:DNA polymerase beta n=1 Tax=Natronogracilivirga saccharolytica TaxID=2812953 RepID=A0A8J7UWZ2_9BACT|nr:DNA polymerase/3'-5' exonuclease PolX [Natronogracilivirga saccharolytica]MBP3192759.1 DNA polymerase/3'-5' exonuclease PolX [Natronogracilivirga saccharolytica]
MPQPVQKDDIVARLEEIGTLMRLAGENDFRAMAFDRAARTIESLDDDINQHIENQTLTNLKGIGKSIAQDVYTYAESGTIPVLDKLKEQVPDGLIAWLGISGMGPKKIYKIHKELGITELSELREKCRDGSVAELPGMGKKTAEKILASIEWMEQFTDRCRVDEATVIAELFLDRMNDADGVQEISVAGSLRRAKETIGDIDLLIAADRNDAESLMTRFVETGSVTEILGQGETKSSVRTKEGRQVDLRIVSREHYPAALMYFTGSKEHNVAMRQRARARKLQLNEYGLFHQNAENQADFDRPLPAKSEEDIYRHLDLGYIPAELREDHGEFDLAQNGSTPELLEQHQLRGIIHAHSKWSDGKNSIREMAEACISRGYEYLVLTDHSRSAAYAGGLSIEKVHQQWEEIDALNKEFAESAGGNGFVILKGIESDILSDGRLDYPDEVLAGFDMVIGSVHSVLDQPPDAMLGRLMQAAEHPHIHMIGHPTGRLLLRRDGNKADLNRLITHAAAHNTAIEINANPWRLELDWRYGRKARDAGLMSAVCPDAHSTDGLDHVRYGVGTARKAGFSAGQILNTLSVKELFAWLKKSG